MKLDFNDLLIVPKEITDINSRTAINPFDNNGFLPLITAPMDTVIDSKNAFKFYTNKLHTCTPRYEYNGLGFNSYSYTEIRDMFDNNAIEPFGRYLIDVANGHMSNIVTITKEIKDKYPYLSLMVGNIANPDTYRKYCEIGVDWIRVGIGGGSACTTSANVSIHFPMASLVNECYEISKEFDNPTKILADGGFRSFSDIIKALALGADACMLGGIFNKCLESCSDNFLKDSVGIFHLVTEEQANINFNEGIDVWKYYRGMSTKEVQKSWNRKELKTGEGISKYNKVEYTLSGWRENFTDYLRSAMSYSNSRTLEEFIGQANWVKISQNAFDRFNK